MGNSESKTYEDNLTFYYKILDSLTFKMNRYISIMRRSRYSMINLQNNLQRHVKYCLLFDHTNILSDKLKNIEMRKIQMENKINEIEENERGSIGNIIYNYIE